MNSVLLLTIFIVLLFSPAHHTAEAPGREGTVITYSTLITSLSPDKEKKKASAKKAKERRETAKKSKRKKEG